MTQRFYSPLVTTLLNKPAIIYPARDENCLDQLLPRDQPGSVEQAVQSILSSQPQLFTKPDYLIAIVWNIEDRLLVDTWAFELDNKSESGPLVTALTLDHSGVVTDLGTTSGDGLVLLGQEELLRRQSPTLQHYLTNTVRIQDFPENCRADERYYG